MVNTTSTYNFCCITQQNNLKDDTGNKEIIKLNHTFNKQHIEWFKNGSALNLIKSNE